jgi:hypothetical protein
VFRLNKDKLEELITSWLVVAESKVDSAEFNKNVWAVDALGELSMNDPAAFWRFIVEAYRTSMSSQVEAFSAASVLEVFVRKFGAEYISQIEKLAIADKKFAYLLGGIWKDPETVDSEVWSKIELLRSSEWLS